MNVKEVISTLLRGPGHIVIDKSGNPRQISRKELLKHEAGEAEFRRRHGIREERPELTIENLLINFLKRFF